MAPLNLTYFNKIKKPSLILLMQTQHVRHEIYLYNSELQNYNHE